MPSISPVSANGDLFYRYKKDVGKLWSLIPLPRPSHCLHIEISNLASPRRRYYKRGILSANMLADSIQV